LLAAAFCGVAGSVVGGCGSSDTTPPDPSSASALAKPSGFTRLDRGAHPLARAEFDVGALDPEKRIAHLSIVFKLTPEQRADRDALLAAQVDRKSPQYRRWLTPEQYAARFGAKTEVVERTKSWLAEQGLEVHSTSRTGSRVIFSGTVAQLERAFQTQMRRYQISGESHYAMSSAPSVPSDLADAILAVHNTHDFHLRPALQRPTTLTPATNSGGTQGLGPTDWANVYDVTKLYTTGTAGSPITGAGVTIAIVGTNPVLQSDIDAFRTTFGLPATSPITQTIVPNTGSPSSTNVPGATAEAVLDIQWASGIGRAASINYVYVGGDDQNVNDATFHAIENNLAPILSESWGGCEADLTPADADAVESLGSIASLLGITYVAASGDAGATTCLQGGGSPAGLYVSIPAAFPGTTSVGGTSFRSLPLSGGIATGYSTTETVWNDANNPTRGLGAGGGGISIVFPRPDYQSTIPTCAIVGSLPAAVTPSQMREVPDISFSASANHYPYFIECTTDATGDCSASSPSPSLTPIGGTSASTPSFAGVVALLNQVAGGRLGNINPLLYKTYTTTTSAFHDITTGNNEVQCRSTDPGCPAGRLYGFAATNGYDCASGLGSLDVYNFAVQVAADANTTTAVVPLPAATTEGANVQLTATVTVPTPNAHALDGNVTFTFQTYLPDGVTPDLSWTLGSSAVTGGTVATGTATWSGPIPPGLVNTTGEHVDVVAFYDGDEHHIGSQSRKVPVTVGPVCLAITPSTLTVQPNGTAQYTATGGVAPYRWFISYDSFCNTLASGNPGQKCSKIDGSTGAFTAGTAAGYVMVSVIDKYGAEMLADVTIGSPGTPPPFVDAGAPMSCHDAGVDSGVEAGVDSGVDAGRDAGVDSGGGVDSGVDAGVDSGGGVDSGVDSGGGVDSGVDSGGGVDSGVDSGGGLDSGSGTDAGADSGGGTDASPDSSSMDDSGSTADSGGADSSVPDSGGTMNDSGALADSGAAADAGDGGDAGSGDTGGSGDSGGCGCTTAGSDTRTSSAMLGAFGLGLAAIARRRRSRNDKK
jgi:MYXO-CTERM domain-containing protein